MYEGFVKYIKSFVQIHSESIAVASNRQWYVLIAPFASRRSSRVLAIENLYEVKAILGPKLHIIILHVVHMSERHGNVIVY